MFVFFSLFFSSAHFLEGPMHTASYRSVSLSVRHFLSFLTKSACSSGFVGALSTLYVGILRMFLLSTAINHGSPT